MPRPSILLADDHAIVMEGLASLLRSEFSLVGTVADGARLIEAARQLRPDVIVTDVAMPGMGGLEALRRLKAEGIAAKVIFLTMHAEAPLAAEALRAGASGFVVKHAAGKELIAAIHMVLRGERYLPPPTRLRRPHGAGGRGDRGCRAPEAPPARGGLADRGGADDEGGRGRTRAVASHRGDPQVPGHAVAGPENHR
jgi:DNA-binding NarL/FixJ family response regulator